MPEIWDPQIPTGSMKDGIDYILTGNSADGARKVKVGQLGGPIAYGTDGSIAGTFVYAGLYGVKGDGTDVTTAFADAVAAAKAAGLPLQLPPGTVKLSPSSTIDLSGVPALLGDTVIDVSGATASPVFSVNGTRELLASGVGLSEGQTSLTVGTGLNIERGDTIVITSVEALPNPARTYYYKGSRVTAESYDSANGTLVVYPGVDFSYSSAYVWRIVEMPLTIGRGITIRGQQDGAQVGIVGTYAAVRMEGALEHFGTAALRLNTSSALVTGTIRDAVYSGTGTSYGVSVNDLSDVHIVGATIVAARHAVAAGGGTWDAGDSGGTSGNAAAYPASYTINGGRYETNSDVAGSYALDAHGVVRSVAITGATVVGGVSVAARENTIVGNIIYFKKYGGLYLGSDNASTSWGRLLFANNVVSGIGETPSAAALRISGSLASAVISNNIVKASYGGSTAVYSTPLYIDGSASELKITNNTIEAANVAINTLVKFPGKLDFSGNRFSGAQIVLQASANNARCSVTNNTVSDSPAYGIYLRGVGYSGIEAVVANNVVFDNQLAGIFIYQVEYPLVSANRCFNNGLNTGASSATRAGIYVAQAKTAHMVGNNCRGDGTNQLYGISVIGESSTVKTEVALIGNITHNNASGNYYLSNYVYIARNGNRGGGIINDFVLATDGKLYKFDGSSWTAV